MHTRLLVVTVVAAISALAGRAAAQVELTGTFIRYLGVAPNGTMLCFSCVVGHSMQYGETTTGPVTCDLYLPGTPRESFTAEYTIGGVRSVFTNASDGGSPDEFTTTVPTAVSGRTITWTGTAGSIRIAQVFELQTADRHAKLTVTLTNTGTSAMTNVYYLRNGEPDHGSCNIGGSFNTSDDVRRQPPAADSALTTAAAGDGTAPGRRVVLGMGAHDTRARVHNGGFFNENPAGEWAAPRDGGGASADEAVDIVFRETSLAAGASTTFEIFYVWGLTVADVESRFDDLGFPSAPCVGLMEGAACTTAAGSMGLCRMGRCCTGCFDGTTCRGGTAAAACGVRGAMCASCVDGDLCSSDVCAAGVCSNPDAPAGTTCDDGVFCTGTDTCNATGMCMGTGMRCDDGDECTTDSCNEATDMCTNAPRPDMPACMAGAAAGVCRSGRCCTGCFDGSACQPGLGIAACGAGGGDCDSCVDGASCTSDACIAGECMNPAAPFGMPCDDGMFCTTTDFCDATGTCAGGGAPRCNDMASCTMDTCDEAMDRCVFTPVAGCTIGGTCYIAGARNPLNTCEHCDPDVSTSGWTSRGAGVECGPSSCTDGMTRTRTCNAAGMCVTSPLTPCPTGRCLDVTACEMLCGAGMPCPAGRWCSATTMMCEMQFDDGEPCMVDESCGSGFCVDGACCTEACDGVCERCDGAGGTCEFVSMGADPDDECTAACDGAGFCEASDAGPTDGGGGTDAARDAGDGDAGGGGGGGGGCCGVAGVSRSSGAPAATLAALLLLGVVIRRRRRR